MEDKHFIRTNDEYSFSKKKKKSSQTIYFSLKLKLRLFPSNQANVPHYFSCWFMLINCLLLIVLLSNYNINISCLFWHKTFRTKQIWQHMDTKADRWYKKSIPERPYQTEAFKESFGFYPPLIKRLIWSFLAAPVGGLGGRQSQKRKRMRLHFADLPGPLEEP